MEATKQALGWNVKEINNSKHWRRRPKIWLFYVCIKLTSSFRRNNENFTRKLFARFIVKLVQVKIIWDHDMTRNLVIMIFQLKVWKKPPRATKKTLWIIVELWANEAGNGKRMKEKRNFFILQISHAVAQIFEIKISGIKQTHKREKRER